VRNKKLMENFSSWKVAAIRTKSCREWQPNQGLICKTVIVILIAREALLS